MFKVENKYFFSLGAADGLLCELGQNFITAVSRLLVKKLKIPLFSEKFLKVLDRRFILSYNLLV